MVDPKDLRNLVAVYEHRHFGKAAKDAGLSQPAITKSIQRLEKQFDFALFDRSRSHVAPTETCEAVVSKAKLIIYGLDDLDRTARMLRGLEIGSLAVGIGPAMSESYVTQAIGWLAHEHPGIQVDVRVDHWLQLLDWLFTGEIELLIADLAAVANDKRFLVTPLPPQEFLWFCRREHPLSNKQNVSRLDLLQYPLATPRMPPWAAEWFKEVISAEKSAPLPTIRCESYSTLKRIVLESDCVSVALTSTIRAEMEDGSLRALVVDAKTLKTNAGIVQLVSRTLSPLATTLVSRIEELASSE